MKKGFFLTVFGIISLANYAQDHKKLSSAIELFNSDEQLKFATTAFYVMDAASGATVFDLNGKTGMAPASTEKIITAATAFDILGSDFTYETKFGILTTSNGKSLYVQASGDPTLGSWRWDDTKEEVVISRLKNVLKEKGITRLESVIINTKGWNDDVIPDGWIWQDLGNYYGAHAQALNWRENQFDLILKSGPNTGDAVSVLKTNPVLYDYKIISQARAAGRETGDNSYLYYPSKGDRYGVLRGTIPAGQHSFTVSGSMYDPVNQFAKTIISSIKDVATVKSSSVETTTRVYENVQWVYIHQSPPLSKIIYWFLRKSINLYGEALLKTMAFRQTGEASTDKGITVIHDHWKDKGIDPEELHLYDGCGLSPQNRITPHAEVSVLGYARKLAWFPAFYEAMPLYNEMKMKSGTINRVKGYTGYQRSKEGKDYIFSMLINNYNGSELSLVRKMYRVLDNLK